MRTIAIACLLGMVSLPCWVAAATSAKGPATPPATATGPTASAPATTQPAFDPTSAYEKREIRGWTIYVNRRLLEKKELSEKVLELLNAKLLEITRTVPAKALEKIRTVPLWMELDNPQVKGGCYHPSRGWLVGHGFNPDKTCCVEFGNAKNFLVWSLNQPSMVLHELAHAYHHQVLGHNNPDILEAYKAAVAAKSYESVLYCHGQMKQAYAITNMQEYFAELTEGWFGVNDFYPFVHAEVVKHDPRMAEVLAKVWGQ